MSSLRTLVAVGGTALVAVLVSACGNAVEIAETNATTVPSATITPTTPPALVPTPIDPAAPAPTTSAGPSPTVDSTTPTTPATIVEPAPQVSPPVDTSVVPGSDPAARGETIDVAPDLFPLGTSVEGRPIVAERYGDPDGRRVLVIGVIHGNEDAGVQVIDELRRRAVPDGVELWLVESMNPDGQAAQDRHNANDVDLNRNFPHQWGPIGEPGHSQYAGTGPASEPETQAMIEFISMLRPDIAIWYHQDANLIIPSTGRDGRIRERYAELTGLPLAECCGGGGIFTGIAATWARTELKQTSDAVPFIVELPGGVLPEDVARSHADAVLTIAVEG